MGVGSDWMRTAAREVLAMERAGRAPIVFVVELCGVGDSEVRVGMRLQVGVLDVSIGNCCRFGKGVAVCEGKNIKARRRHGAL